LGYFENSELKRRMKAYHGWSLTEKPPSTIIGWRDIVESVVRRQGYRFGPWAFKTGAHYAGVWEEFSPLMIKVTRNRDAIVRSYEKYGGIHRALGRGDFLSVIDRGLERLRTLPGVEIDTDGLITGRRDQIRRAIESAGLQYRDKTVDSIVNPEFWHAG
jgi:hypothetical protein